MKRVVFASVLLLLLAAASLAEGSNYQIYSEGKGFMGWGGRRVIMLDKTTGDSWLYVDNKWKLIAKEATAEVTASADEISAKKAEEANAKLEAEIASLKEKHLAEIKALTDKQEQELTALRSKLEAGQPSAAKAAVEPAVRKAKPVVAKKKVEAAKAAVKEEDTDNGGSDAPPAWLTE